MDPSIALTTSTSSSTNSSSLSPAPLTSKATSSSSAVNESLAVAKLLEGVPMWSPAEALKLKQLLTAQKPKLVLPAHGSSERPFAPLHSLPSSNGYNPAKSFVLSPSLSPKSTPEIDHVSGTLLNGSSQEVGGRFHASTSVEQPAPESPLWSTMPLATPTYTPFQVKRRYGSTVMPDSLYSSLTNLREQLNVKRSYESWMAIHTRAQSKEGSSVLAGLSWLFAPTQTSMLASAMPYGAASLAEDSSESQDNEEMTNMSDSLHSSETLSGSEEEYRYSKRARQQARLAWLKSDLASEQSEDSATEPAYSDTE